jgi:hypothetical protein
LLFTWVLIQQNLLSTYYMKNSAWSHEGHKDMNHAYKHF